MADILFIKTSSLGDVIHHMPAVTEARRHCPAARFAWVVEEDFAPLVALHPAIDTVIPVASRRWRRQWLSPSTWPERRAFRHALRERAYDTVIDTQGLFRSALIARRARGEHHGYDAASIKERAAAAFYDVRHRVDRSLHAITRNRLLTGLALGYTPEGNADFGLDRAALSGGAEGTYAVLLHATARREKEWPVEHWIALGNNISARGYDLVIPWGSETERERSAAIVARVARSSAPDRRALDHVARQIAGASLVIGVDTGLTHLAGALGVPLVAVFAGTEPGLYGPMGAGPIAVVGDKRGAPPVDEVMAAVDRVGG
ncbi:MAG: heptosyltransferase [Hyphomicrobiales bacterium]|jgi:heptosyltransferase-1|nr:heptosyltransferase [Hyphomicrobiales bacterium]